MTETMACRVESINAGGTVSHAAELMRKHGIAWLHVLDQGKVLGVISQRDIVVGVVALGLDPERTKVREMTAAVEAWCRPLFPVEARVRC